MTEIEPDWVSAAFGVEAAAAAAAASRRPAAASLGGPRRS